MNCQSQINYCSPNPCTNGNCTQLIGSYACVCPQNYAGTRCEIYSNACVLQNPCRNNAICLDQGNGNYKCNCLPGYTGTNCELSVNPCDASPCKNQGKPTQITLKLKKTTLIFKLFFSYLSSCFTNFIQLFMYRWLHRSKL